MVGRRMAAEGEERIQGVKQGPTFRKERETLIG